MENYKDANINIMGIVSNSSRGDVLKALTEHFTAEETSLTKKTFFFFFFLQIKDTEGLLTKIHT